MQVQSSKPAADDAGWASAEILRITVGQLRAWEVETARHRVLQPPPDDQAWEGTELDVRRTVL